VKLFLWHNSRVLMALANVLIAGVVVLMVVWFAQWLVQRPMFVLKEVVIQPSAGSQLNQVSAQLLKQSAQKLMLASSSRKQVNFFTVDLADVRQGFEGVPWVRHASVRRIWPNRLLVQIEEHRALAYWQDAQLLNTFGEPFTANLGEAEAAGHLPRLDGPEGSHLQVLRRFDDLQRWSADSGRHLVALKLSSRHSWSAELDDGVELVIGREQAVSVEERVRRWAIAYPKVMDQLASKPDWFDLRYPNGFAVRAATVVSKD
jgi:cell division protein FtsQ